MIFHENRLLEDDSHVVRYLIFVNNWKRCRKIVVCCNCDSRLRVKNGVMENGLIWNRIEYVGKISPVRDPTFAKIATIFLPLLNGYAVFSLGSGYFP